MKKYFILFISLFILTGCQSNDENTLTIYTTRHYEIDRQIFDEFEKETGINLNVVEMRGEELVTRLVTEGENTPADIVMMVGAEHIYTLDQEMGVLQPLKLPTITDQLDDTYYGDNWFSFAKRSRDVLVSNDFNADINSYFDLANPEFSGEILVRSSSNLYNQAWIAAMIQVYGQEKVEEFLPAFVANFAQNPDGGDRDQVRGVLAGNGNIAIANGYYLHGMLASNDTNEVNAAENVEFSLLDVVFENISFAGKVSNNPLADEFLLFLNDQQGLIASENGEVPTDKNVQFDNYISGRKAYNVMPVNFETLGKSLSLAYDLMLKHGWQ